MLTKLQRKLILKFFLLYGLTSRPTSHKQFKRDMFAVGRIYKALSCVDWFIPLLGVHWGT